METLLLLARTPHAAAPQSRLAAARGDADARALSTAFLLDLADTCERWRTQRLGADLNRRVVVCSAEGSEHPVLIEAAARAGARFEPLRGATPAAQLANAFELEFEHGARAICAIGAETPTLPAHLLDEAFRALVWERVVLGPTFEGGLWLVGAQRPAPEVFGEVSWSDPSALTHTLEKARAAGVEPHLVPFWYPVDPFADLERLTWHAQSLRARHPGAVPETWRTLRQLGLLPGAEEAL